MESICYILFISVNTEFSHTLATRGIALLHVDEFPLHSGPYHIKQVTRESIALLAVWK